MENARVAGGIAPVSGRVRNTRSFVIGALRWWGSRRRFAGLGAPRNAGVREPESPLISDKLVEGEAVSREDARPVFAMRRFCLLFILIFAGGLSASAQPGAPRSSVFWKEVDEHALLSAALVGRIPLVRLKVGAGEPEAVTFTRFSVATDLSYVVHTARAISAFGTDLATGSGGEAMSGPGFVSEIGPARAFALKSGTQSPSNRAAHRGAFSG